MEESINAQQQLSRRNCLLLHGIEETKGEDTDNIVLVVLNSDMDLNISKTAPDHSHRIGNPESKQTSRPIIIKFVWYYDRRDLFMKKTCLTLTAWKVSKYGVFSGSYLVWIQENTDQKKLRVWTLFTQCLICVGVCGVNLPPLPLLVFS